MDLIAVGRAALLPDDDLTLACASSRRSWVLTTTRS